MSTSIRLSTERCVDRTSLMVGDCRLVDGGHGGRDRAPSRHRGVTAGFADHGAWRASSSPVGRRSIRSPTNSRQPGRVSEAAVRVGAAARRLPGRHDRRLRRRAAPDVGQPVLEVRPPLHLDQLRRPRHDGLLHPGRHRGQGRACPTAMVWAVDGDGCFQMTGQELVTASVERIPIKVALLNNAYLGMVRQWQELFYEERYSEVHLSLRPARLRQVGRVDGLRRLPGRGPRRGRGDHRQGQRGQRPARWWSSSAACRPRRCTPWSRPAAPTTTSSSTRPSGSRPRTTVDPSPAGGHHRRRRRLTTVNPRTNRTHRRSSSRTRPASWPGWPTSSPAGLQHRVAGRRPDQRRPVQPAHHRGRHRVDPARPDRQAAVQADQRGRDRRVGPGVTRWSGSCCWPPSR